MLFINFYWQLSCMILSVFCIVRGSASADDVSLDKMAKFVEHKHRFERDDSHSRQSLTLDFAGTESPKDIFLEVSNFTTESITIFPNPDNETVTQSNIISSCTAFINKFSEAASNFTKCSIVYARPLRFCEKCVHHYVNVKSVYHVLMEGLTKDDDGRLCGDTIVNSDRIQIVAKTAQFIDDLWNDCDCGNCFVPFNETDDTLEVHMSNESLHFIDLDQKAQHCFHNFTKGDIFPYTVNTTRLCSECAPDYHALNDFYMELAEKYEHEVCMDIVDSMNYTRLKWSKSFQCSQAHGDLLTVLLLSAFFCLLPVVFYTTLKIYGVKEQNKMLHEKRMRDVTVTRTNATDSANE